MLFLRGRQAPGPWNGHSCCAVHLLRHAPQLPLQASALHADPAKAEGLELAHDIFSRNTRLQLRQLFDAVRALTMPPDPPKRPIGFVPPEEKKMPKAKGKK